MMRYVDILERSGVKRRGWIECLQTVEDFEKGVQILNQITSAGFTSTLPGVRGMSKSSR